MSPKMADQNFLNMARKMHYRVKANPQKFATLQSKCVSSNSYEDIFSSIWDLEEAHEMLNPDFINLEKSDAEANKLRLEGNHFYKTRDLERAMEKYNQSIMTASHPVVGMLAGLTFQHPDTEEFLEWTPIDPVSYGGTTKGPNRVLAMAYANRSAVLFERNFYGKCLEDIQLALEHGYPTEMRNKLEARKAKCLAAKPDPDQEKKLMASPQKDPGQEGAADPTSPTKGIELGKLLAPMAEARQRMAEPLSLKDLSIADEDPPKVIMPNEVFPVLSTALKVNYTPAKGRGFVATRDINTGEVLGSESAYCVNFIVDELQKYCSFCLGYCLTPLPCPSCRKVVFCSVECRANSLSQEHWLECKLLPSMISLELANKIFAYKMLRSYNFNQMKRVLGLVKEVEYKSLKDSGCDQAGIYHSSAYQSIHYLCSNMEHQGFEILFLQCQLAFTLTKLLEKSERFFIDENGKTFTPTREDMVTTGAIMLSHSIKLHYNPYEILDLKLKKPVGAGLFPALSLLNHSCSPAAKHYSIGRNLILRAMRPIAAGEEVTDSYTADFQDTDYESRKEYLKTYFIKCTCEACVGNWPVYAQLKTLVFKCLICCEQDGGIHAVCQTCLPKTEDPSQLAHLGVMKDIHDNTKELWQAIYRVIKIGLRMTSNRCLTDRDFEYICNTIELLHKLAVAPCQTMRDMENILLQTFEFGK